MTKNIFVYGTLKSGYHNHRILGSDAEFLGEVVIAGFKLFESGIPFMKRTNNTKDCVLGEIYTVTDKNLVHVDHLEGHPTGYRREPVFGDDDDLETYIYPHDLRDMKESPKNEDGVYVYGRAKYE